MAAFLPLCDQAKSPPFLSDKMIELGNFLRAKQLLTSKKFHLSSLFKKIIDKNNNFTTEKWRISRLVGNHGNVFFQVVFEGGTASAYIFYRYFLSTNIRHYSIINNSRKHVMYTQAEKVAFLSRIDQFHNDRETVRTMNPYAFGRAL